MSECELHGHKPYNPFSDGTKYTAFELTAHRGDGTSSSVRMQLCTICRLVYWEGPEEGSFRAELREVTGESVGPFIGVEIDPRVDGG